MLYRSADTDYNIETSCQIQSRASASRSAPSCRIKSLEIFNETCPSPTHTYTYIYIASAWSMINPLLPIVGYAKVCSRKTRGKKCLPKKRRVYLYMRRTWGGDVLNYSPQSRLTGALARFLQPALYSRILFQGIRDFSPSCSLQQKTPSSFGSARWPPGLDLFSRAPRKMQSLIWLKVFQLLCAFINALADLYIYIYIWREARIFRSNGFTFRMKLFNLLEWKKDLFFFSQL